MDETTPLVRDHVLVRPIGEGGFGKVWLARSEVGTYRAVKIVSRSAVKEEHDFNREFNGMQRFEPFSRSHEGLVDILQIGRAADDSYFYYVMELGDDVEPRQEFAPADYRPRTLAAECRRRRIPAVEAALIGAQLADALNFLHDHGLIHRDIKPSNVLFVQGHARIGDPGLVVAIEASQSIGGTLGYIAPEGPGTPRADIYGLGKLLYVASTGKEPGEFPLLPTDMTSYADAADLRRLNLIVLRACSYNPADRYSSALELRKDLLEVHAGGSPGEIRRRLRLARRVGAVLALALLVILGFYFRAQLQAKAERTRLARSHKESANRLQDDNDTLAALPYLGSMLTTEPDDDQLREAAARRIGFIWRHGPRLCQQWYFGNAVNRVAFSPSGHELAIASASGTVWRWRWLTQSPAVLGRHGNPGAPAEAESVSYSADGRSIASVGDDSTLRLWPVDDRDGSPKTIPLNSSGHAVTFHPKESVVAVGCEDGQILLVDLHEPRPPRYLLSRTNDAPSGTDAVLSVAFSADGRRLVAGGRDGWIRELDLTEQQPIRRRKLLWVYDVSLNRDGSSIAAASDHRAYLNPFSDVTSARLRHRTFVRSVSFDPTRGPGEDRLLTSCFDRTVRLWSCADDTELIPPIHTDRQPSCAIFSPDGQYVAIATISGLVRIYQLPSTTGSADRIATTVAPDGSHYARVHDHTNVVVFEATSNSIARKVSLSGPRINRVDLSRNGTRMLTRHEIEKGTVRFAAWGPDADRPIAVTNMQGKVFAWWNPEGDCVVFHQTNALVLWQPAQGTSSSWPWSIADLFDGAESRFSEASRRLVAAWGTNVIVLSTTNTSQIAYRPFPHKAASVDIDPSGTRVVVGESPPGLTPSQSYVWSIPDWKPISPPLAHEDGIFHARFSPSGRWLILADQSGGCTVYDTSNWNPIPLRQDFGMVTDATFGHDERFVATLTENRGKAIPTIRVWELPGGDPATSLMRADAPEWGRLKFLGQDASLCWSAPGANYWHQWGLEKLTASSRDLADLTQLLSCGRVTAAGVSVPLDGQELQRLWLRLWESHPDWFALTNR
jgi:WD40 repeat protein